MFSDWSDTFRFNPVFGSQEIIPTLNEPQNPDYNPPGRVDTIVSRIIRDTELSRNIKKENNWMCQICGSNILLPNTGYYSEGHHLQPLGGEHQGPDVRENIIILCPTHHTEFDYGSIAINPSNNLIEHIDDKNPFHNQPLAYRRKDLGNEYLSYHYKVRFNIFN
ncbi:MAG TPA: HNH endonuclease [Cyclobacteriaceae bacterium]|nr:HNH endonuclease [Cyclobacteriaceae bacterium]